MTSSMMQNPSDPDATFRTKAGKDYVGYAANLDESVGANGSVVTDYQVEQNNYHDSTFFKDSMDRNGISEEPSTIVTDGAYYGKENEELARENNVTLVTTAVSGVEVPDIYADFVLNEEGTRVLKCPAGHTPKSCSQGSHHLYVLLHQHFHVFDRVFVSRFKTYALHVNAIVHFPDDLRQFVKRPIPVCDTRLFPYPGIPVRVRCQLCSVYVDMLQVHIFLCEYVPVDIVKHFFHTASHPVVDEVCYRHMARRSSPVQYPKKTGICLT